MQQMQAPADAIDKARQSGESQACEIWPENWDALTLFLAMGTQWRAAAGMSGIVWLGLDYAALPVCMRSLRLPLKRLPELLPDLHIMEIAAREVRNDRRP